MSGFAPMQGWLARQALIFEPAPANARRLRGQESPATLAPRRPVRHAMSVEAIARPGRGGRPSVQPSRKTARARARRPTHA